MSNWLKSLLTGAGVAVVAFFIFQSAGAKKSKKRYTVHYVVELIPGSQPSRKDPEEAMTNMPAAIRRRTDDLGYKPVIKRTGNRTLDITISDVRDTAMLRQAITRNSRLEFRELYVIADISTGLMALEEEYKRLSTPPPVADEKINDTLPKLHLAYPAGVTTLIDYTGSFLFSHGQTTYATIGFVRKTDTALLRSIFNMPVVKDKLPYDLLICYGTEPDHENDMLNLYAIRTRMDEAQIQNRDIQYAKVINSDSYPEISFQLNSPSARRWETMTRNNIGKFIAIVLDDKIISAPKVDGAVTGGNSTIRGGFNRWEAELLAYQLRTGVLPASLRMVNEEFTRLSPFTLTRAAVIMTLGSFIIGTLASLAIFNMLKNS